MCLFLQIDHEIMDQNRIVFFYLCDTPGNIPSLTHTFQSMIADPVDRLVIAFMIMSLEDSGHFF